MQAFTQQGEYQNPLKTPIAETTIAAIKAELQKTIDALNVENPTKETLGKVLMDLSFTTQLTKLYMLGSVETNNPFGNPFQQYPNMGGFQQSGPFFGAGFNSPYGPGDYNSNFNTFGQWNNNRVQPQQRQQAEKNPLMDGSIVKVEGSSYRFRLEAGEQLNNIDVAHHYSVVVEKYVDEHYKLVGRIHPETLTYHSMVDVELNAEMIEILTAFVFGLLSGVQPVFVLPDLLHVWQVSQHKFKTNQAEFTGEWTIYNMDNQNIGPCRLQP